jgi:hypothetical protein
VRARARVCVCVSVALGIQYAKRMRRIILPSAACLAVPYFFHISLSHKRHDFRKKKVTEKETCVLIFSTDLPETFLILRIIQRDIIINIHRSSTELEFSRHIFEKY